MRRQLDNLRVREIDEYGSVTISLVGRELPRKASMGKLDPEGVAHDADGVPISVMVFADSEGFLAELQIFKADGTAIVRLPSVDAFDII